jgi:hypothetical protein
MPIKKRSGLSAEKRVNRVPAANGSPNSRTAAKEFGRSDNGLAKICRKLGVKKPPRGFWAKVATDLWIKKRPIRDEIPEISVRENLQGRARLVTATQIELGRVKPEKYGVLDVRQDPGIGGRKQVLCFNRKTLRNIGRTKTGRLPSSCIIPSG